MGRVKSITEMRFILMEVADNERFSRKDRGPREAQLEQNRGKSCPILPHNLTLQLNQAIAFTEGLEKRRNLEKIISLPSSPGILYP